MKKIKKLDWYFIFAIGFTFLSAILSRHYAIFGLYLMIYLMLSIWYYLQVIKGISYSKIITKIKRK